MPLSRPLPPPALRDPERRHELIVPALEVRAWAFASFIDRDGPLFNPEHVHLAAAKVGVLWTNIPATRQMRRIVGMAEQPQPRGPKWQVKRSELQLREWFGFDPDFVITLDSVHATICTDASFCALVEHELLHCGHARDAFGAPRFMRDGRPVFGIRDHDVSEFVSVVRRYSPAAAGRAVIELVTAAANIAASCGTCMAGK